jgi:Domain of unknown function (DUF4111)
VPLPEQVTRITTHFLTAIDAAAPGLVQGLYLHGSLALTGEFFPGSDIDFAAVLVRQADAAGLDALAAAHAQVRAASPSPLFEGIHLLPGDLARPPDECQELPHIHDGTFSRAGRFSVNPVTWHELAGHGITLRGPDVAAGQLKVWTDDRVLREYTRDNLSSYWAARLPALAGQPDYAAIPDVTSWFVLGVSRLHHLLGTGSMTSKSGAGRYALTVFDPAWHPIIDEALRARERPQAPSRYDSDVARRGEETIAFTSMAIESGLALARLSRPVPRPGRWLRRR